MGYSCTARAAYALDAITALIIETGGHGSSNTWDRGGWTYFWERGREAGDGAIVGSVWRMNVERETCRRVGALKISSDGDVVRFAHIERDWKLAAELYGAVEYEWVHGAAERGVLAAGGIGYEAEVALAESLTATSSEELTEVAS